MKNANKKALYESIMASVAREVKKALNESMLDDKSDFLRKSIKNTINSINKKLDIISNIGINYISFRPIKIDSNTKLDMIRTDDHVCLTTDIETDEWNDTDFDLNEILDELEYYGYSIDELQNLNNLMTKIYNILE